MAGAPVKLLITPWLKIYGNGPYEFCRVPIAMQKKKVVVLRVPVEFNINTRKFHYLFRPFERSQAYDWERGCYTGVVDAAKLEEERRTGKWNQGNFDIDQIVWKHWNKTPQREEVWERL